MSNVVSMGAANKKDELDVTYVMDDKDRVIGVGHQGWPFTIMRKDDEIALVCNETEEPFGICSREQFNTILMCWLLIDQPELIAEDAFDD